MAKKATEPELPAEVRDELDIRLGEATALAQRARKLECRRQAATAGLANRTHELEEVYQRRIDRLRARREEILSVVAAMWDEHLRRRTSTRLPGGRAIRQTARDGAVGDPEEVIDALDRWGRLDLVRSVVDERGLVPLYREGKLAGLPQGAIHVKVTDRFVVRHTKKAKCARSYECACECPLDSQNGSGGGPQDAA